MIKTTQLVRVALVVAVAVAVQVAPIHGHDDGLTCHEHPGGGWKVWIELNSPPSGFLTMMRLNALIRVQVDEVGDARIAAQGTVALRHDFAHDWAVLTIDHGSTMACSEVGMTGFNLPFQSPRDGERANLEVVPLEPIRAPGRHAVRFRLVHGSGVIEQDGAILVVDIIDGPMP
jgi:hypothetical protein